MSSARLRMMAAMIGTTTDPVLPSGYTRLEYVQGTGEKNLPLGIGATTNDVIVIDLQDPSETSGSTNIYCSHGDKAGRWFGRISTGKYGIGNSSANIINVMASVRTVCTLYYTDTTTFHLEANGLSATRVSAGVWGSWNLFGESSYSTCRIYSFKLTRSGTDVMNLVPCKNSDNKVGFYDTVTDTFLEY